MLSLLSDDSDTFICHIFSYLATPHIEMFVSIHSGPQDIKNFIGL